MNENNHIVLFDGLCNLCSGSVQWIIQHDKNEVLKFTSLQSEIGKKLCTEYGISEEYDSIIYIKNGTVFYKSTAALNIARHCGVWKFWYVFIVVPAFIRDFIYDLIAKNRYRWFGKKTVCWIPNPQLASRFL